MRFLHTADWHLGRSFPGFSREQREELRRGRMETLRRLLEHARNREVGLVLVAGDQIDSEDTSADGALRELLGVLGEYQEMRIVMITGNHDPASPLGIFNRIDSSLYPDHLTVVNGRKTLELEEGAVLYAASPSEKNGTENPLAWIPQRSAGQGIRIGLAHGSLAIPGRHKSDDFPIPPSFAEEAELDYLALGHWHSRYIHDQRTAYPGTHEPLGFGERSGALEVEIPGGGEAPVITPVEIEPHFTWRSEQRRFSGSLPEEILDLLRSSAPREILRLHAEGELSAGEQETLQTAKEIAAENRFALFTEDHTRIAGEIEGLAETEGIGYLAQVIRRMEEGETVSAPSGSWGSVDTAEVRDAALRRIRDFLKREELL